MGDMKVKLSLAAVVIALASAVSYLRYGDTDYHVYLVAKQFIENQLKCPASAVFPNIWQEDVIISSKSLDAKSLPKDQSHLAGQTAYLVEGYVDAQNPMGAMVRNWFNVFFVNLSDPVLGKIVIQNADQKAKAEAQQKEIEELCKSVNKMNEKLSALDIEIADTMLDKFNEFCTLESLANATTKVKYVPISKKDTGNMVVVRGGPGGVTDQSIGTFLRAIHDKRNQDALAQLSDKTIILLPEGKSVRLVGWSEGSSKSLGPLGIVKVTLPGESAQRYAYAWSLSSK